MNKLWFNQSGEEEGEKDLPLGDTIDKFTPSGELAYSHPFDESGVPEEVKITTEIEHCEYIKTELENNYSELNFANSQIEIEKIYSKIDMLEEIQQNQKCN